jgi:hypothetical protein
MKKIKLKEEQLRLFEKLIKEEDAPNFDGGTVKEFGDESESGKIAPENTSDVDGNAQLGSAVKQLGTDLGTPQSYWYNGVSGMRRVP